MLILYTIGHSNLEMEVFLEHLRHHGITMVVDVRTTAKSGYVPHFNRDNLEAALPQAGIEYRYAGEYLGGQPKEASVYKEGVRPEKDNMKPSDFRKQIHYPSVMMLPTYRKGLTHLVRLVQDAYPQQGRVAIMCSEGDPRDCHRHHLIARSLLDPELKVIDTTLQVCHILRDGTLEPPLDPQHEFKPEPPEQMSLF